MRIPVRDLAVPLVFFFQHPPAPRRSRLLKSPGLLRGRKRQDRLANRRLLYSPKENAFFCSGIRANTMPIIVTSRIDPQGHSRPAGSPASGDALPARIPRRCRFRNLPLVAFSIFRRPRLFRLGIAAATPFPPIAGGQPSPLPPYPACRKPKFPAAITGVFEFLRKPALLFLYPRYISTRKGDAGRIRCRFPTSHLSEHRRSHIPLKPKGKAMGA